MSPEYKEFADKFSLVVKNSRSFQYLICEYIHGKERDRLIHTIAGKSQRISLQDIKDPQELEDLLSGVSEQKIIHLVDSFAWFTPIRKNRNKVRSLNFFREKMFAHPGITP